MLIHFTCPLCGQNQRVVIRPKSASKQVPYTTKNWRMKLCSTCHKPLVIKAAFTITGSFTGVEPYYKQEKHGQT